MKGNFIVIDKIFFINILYHQYLYNKSEGLSEGLKRRVKVKG